MVRKNLLKGFKKPKGITFEHSEVEANYGRFVAYPSNAGTASPSATPCAGSSCRRSRGMPSAR